LDAEVRRSSDGTIAETDARWSPNARSIPDLRALAAAGNRLSVEKLLAGIWRRLQRNKIALEC